MGGRGGRPLDSCLGIPFTPADVLSDEMGGRGLLVSNDGPRLFPPLSSATAPCSIALSGGSHSNSDNTKALVEQATVKGWQPVPVSTSSSQGQEPGARLSDLPASGRAGLRPRPTTHGDGQTKGSESLPVPTCIQSRAIGRGGPLEGKCRHLGWPPRRVITTSC